MATCFSCFDTLLCTFLILARSSIDVELGCVVAFFLVDTISPVWAQVGRANGWLTRLKLGKLSDSYKRL